MANLSALPGPTPTPKRWPNNAEHQRREIYASATEARQLLDRADALVKRLEQAVADYNKSLAAEIIRDIGAILGSLRADLADARTMMSDVQRFAVEAKTGTEK